MRLLSTTYLFCLICLAACRPDDGWPEVPADLMPAEATTGPVLAGPPPAILIDTRSIPRGGECPSGGIEVLIGYDDGRGDGVSGDGVLQEGEVTQRRMLCQTETAPAASRVAKLEPGCSCEFGGIELQTGLDDGAGGGVAGDGVLQAGEIRGRLTECKQTAPPGVTTGLDTLPDNLTCQPPVGPALSQAVRMVRAFPSLEFSQPVALKQRPGFPNRYFVVEQTGKIKSFLRDAVSADVALDLSKVVRASYEPGLLQLAFHPARAEVYVVYNHITTTPGLKSVWTLSRFQLQAGSDYLINASSEEVLLTIPKQRDEHNGGGALFGPDGMLYVAVGDDDDIPSRNAQNPFSLLGKFLRLDVDSRPAPGKTYVIPRDNPFDGTQAAPEIWALGFRNPWRWSFDPQTGDLWVGDVGATSYEEVDKVLKGKNYGWGLREGKHCVAGDITTDVNCDMTGFEPPVAEYPHSDGCSVTGGLVYRGTAIPALRDRFLYGDFCQGHVWGIDVNLPTADPRFFVSTLAGNTPFDGISAFEIDSQGAVHVLALGGWGTPGRIYKMEAATLVTPSPLLSASGCVDAADPRKPAAGAFPYAVNSPLYTDQSVCKERFLFLPRGGQIFVGADGRLDLPTGSVLMKHFRDGNQLIETRFMMRHGDGDWSGWSYRWNDEQTDAVLLPDGDTRRLENGVTWRYPDRGDCLHCHTRPTLRAIGLEVAQLNRVGYFPATGRWANQLATLATLGKLQNGLPAYPSALPALVSPMDGTAARDARARSYLHGNCSFCHQPGGGGYGGADYRYTTPLAMTGACNSYPIVSGFGLPDARLIAPGSPARSVLVHRLSVNGAHQMNPYRNSVDEVGVALMKDWIGTLRDCSPP